MIRDGTFKEHFQTIFDFLHFPDAQTGENVGGYSLELDNIHYLAGCKPHYIGSHTVNGATFNAGASRSLLRNVIHTRSTHQQGRHLMSVVM